MVTKPDHDIDHFFAEQFEIRGGSRAAATSKIECFVIMVNGWKPLTIITKHSILDVAAALDPLLEMKIFLVTPLLFITFLSNWC